MSKFLFLLTFCLFISSTLFSQKLNHVLGEVLIQPSEGEKIDEIISQFQTYRNQITRFEIVRQVSKTLDIWLLRFDYNSVNEFQFLALLKKHRSIKTVQFNHLVDMRSTIPDDPFFDDQWQYINDGSNSGLADADIDAELAWDITTGGLTLLGDTIVVAVLDSGIDLNHNDFGDNLWINYAEVPNNGIDDDNNGYIDDYRGWSIETNDDDIAASVGHGTAVAGIVGAQGNNGIGVTGVNWDVKIMVIKNDFNTNEAAVLEAYAYALDARIKYNNSNGLEGAFVVATNASWGVDMGDPEDAPLWCSFYDIMGEAGITSCGATINGNTNVDEEGDLPTACSSNFLISVTNMNRMDNKVIGAGFGANSIDLGAHGADVFTTTISNNYGAFGGTSGATPHVTGAIALLYAAPCDNLAALAKVDPAAAADFAKQYILDGVDPNASLAGITLTEGRLNIFNSLTLLMDNCSPCPPAYYLAADQLTDVSTNLTWSTGVNSSTSNLRWRELGDLEWNETINASSPFPLMNLIDCTQYEFQIDAICNNESSGYSESFIFTTDGCCEPPSDIIVSDLSINSVTISWNSVLAAESYNLQYFSPIDEMFITGITETSIVLNTLNNCSPITVILQTVCANEVSTFSNSIEFITPGCGACLDFNYCESSGANADFEWIDAVKIGGLVNNSGPDNGYGDHTDLSTDLMAFNTYDIELTPDFDGSAFEEYFKIWIDFNHDGIFDPITELAFDAGSGSMTTVTGTLTIPGTATLGSTRLRVGMEWIGSDDMQEPEICEVFPFGEVEDYCINIIEGTPPSCDLPVNLDTTNVLEDIATLLWEDPSDDHTDHNLRIKKIQEVDWIVFNNINPPFTIIDLEDCSTYEFQVEANCLVENETSGYTQSFEFDTQCISATTNTVEDENIVVYPNPFSSTIHIELNINKTGPSKLQLIDIKGQIVFEKEMNTFLGHQILEINKLSSLADGIYIIRILTPDGPIWNKIIKG